MPVVHVISGTGGRAKSWGLHHFSFLRPFWARTECPVLFYPYDRLEGPRGDTSSLRCDLVGLVACVEAAVAWWLRA